MGGEIVPDVVVAPQFSTTVAGSIWQVALHPSPDVRLPSSQLSPASNARLPQGIATHVPPTSAKPAMHVIAHIEPVQSMRPFAGAPGQGAHVGLHDVTLSITHALPGQSRAGAVHAGIHVPADEHVTVPPNGATHGVHAGPHSLVDVSSAQWLPQMCEPMLHRNEHVPVHTGKPDPLAGPGQRLAHEPQLFTSVRKFTQLAPQTVSPAAHELMHVNVPPLAAQSPIAPVQVTPHAPQLGERERSVSHPSSGAVLQFARPGRHAPVNTQAPAVQRTDAGATPGNAMQLRAQLPQRSGVSSRTQPLPQFISPAAHVPASTTSMLTGASGASPTTSTRGLSIATSSPPSTTDSSRVVTSLS